MARILNEKHHLVKCQFCGEMYSPTYKRCPFCNGDGTGRWDDLEQAVRKASESEVVGEYDECAWETDEPDELEEEEKEYTAQAARAKVQVAEGEDIEEEETPAEENTTTFTPKGGGKRLLVHAVQSAGTQEEPPYSYGDGRRRGPSIGEVLGVILALGLISAAVYITISAVRPLLTSTQNPTIASEPPGSELPQDTLPAGDNLVTESTVPDGAQIPPDTADSTDSTAPNLSAAAPTSFSLSKTDFTFNAPGQFYQVKVSFQPDGADAPVTWTSSDPNIATVSLDGRVTAVGRGTATVTAAVSGVGERSCIVRCALNTSAPSQTGGGEGHGQESAAPAAALKLNREDFTLLRKGETFQMQVSGTTSQVTWSSSNEKVASVASDGTVTGVGRGNCTVKATVDGQTLKCIVRCNF